MCTVVLLVILRLSLGWHFFYEGVWKIQHADKFSSEPFLTQAKGPAAPLFYAMVSDLDGRERLAIEATANSDAVIANWRKAHAGWRSWFDKELSRKIKATEVKIKKLGAGSEKERGELTKELETAKKRRKDRLAKFDQAALAHLWEMEDKLEAYLTECEEAMRSGEGKVAGETREVWATEIGRIEKECHDLYAKIAEEKTGKAPKISQVVSADKAKLRKDINKILPIKPGIKGSSCLSDWGNLKAKIVKKYNLDDVQQHKLETLFRRYKDELKKYLAENLDDVNAYFGSLERLQDRKDAGTNGAAHEQERIWDEQQKLRREAASWFGDLEQMDDDFRSAAWRILTPEQKELGQLPQKFTFSDFVDFALTWSLTAIGFCLLLGLFTRPAALGGAVFLFFVLLTQPPWPTIYPPAPGVVGHAMGIDKNFIELIALLVIASCAAGRWAGLDYFVEHYIIKWSKCCPCMKCLCKTDESAQAADTKPDEATGEKTEAAEEKDEKSEKDPEKEENPKTEKEGD